MICYFVRREAETENIGNVTSDFEYIVTLLNTQCRLRGYRDDIWCDFWRSNDFIAQNPSAYRVWSLKQTLLGRIMIFK